jgi:simple sugar transport system ATP-binding protein
MPPSPRTPSPASDYEDIVRLEKVQKFFGAIQGLRDIDLKIGRNEIVGLIGDNGAGRSTVIKNMTGGLRATSGPIFVRDPEIDGAPIPCARPMTSIETVYQDKSLAEKQPLWRTSLPAARSPTASASSM